jgi:signal transduction histidine kinase
VLWNLLSNAIKFTTEGYIRVSARRDGTRAHVSVEDTGIGIQPESIPLLFQRYWQGDRTVTREHGGLGLGLALARHFMEMHGGEITATSEGLGRGATFHIRVPLLAR